MQWKCFVLLLVAVTAVAGQAQDYNDYDASWWSNEASDDQLGIDQPAEYDQEPNDNNDEPIYEDDFEQSVNEENDKQFDDIDPEPLDVGNKESDDTINQSQEEDTQLLEGKDNFNLDEIQEKLDEADAENVENVNEASRIVSDEIKAPQELDLDTLNSPDSEIDNLDDYQIEDNRSQVKEPSKAESSDNDENFEPNDEPEDPIADIEANLSDDSEINYPKLSDVIEKPGQQNDDLNQLSEQTEQLLEEDISSSEVDFENDQQDEVFVPENINEDNDKKSDDERDQFFEDVIENKQNEEIQSFIEENKSSFNDDTQEKESDRIIDESIKYENDMIEPEKNNAFVDLNSDTEDGFKGPISELDDNNNNNSDEDTVDKVYTDLNADLAQLFETMDKLSDNSKSDKTLDSVVDKYEQQYNKPYGEDTILSQRQDYDNYGDLNDESIQSNLADIFDESDSAADSNADVQDNEIETQIFDLVLPKSVDKSNEETDTVDETQPMTNIKTIDVEDLKPAQYNDLMVQFAATHVEEIDTLREDFGRSVAAVHITLTDSEVTEITSPNFPGTYPTNNVIDWILEGDGAGIELNVTDLELRGAQGDFLLIIPGGADSTSHDGLVFSYHLNEPRQYRFTDVSKMFVRFESGTGLGFLKGFRMTVKMIWPPESDDSNDVPPIPAPLLPSPPSLLTVTLGGVNQKELIAIQDEFQRLIADMATMFIFVNGIEAGDNATSKVTQLTSIAYCNVNWPNSEQCVQVTFGVPLVNGDEAPTRLNATDLKAMWETYSVQDPFATRLRKMGISEFAVPNDARVLLTWSLLVSGVILSVILLAFALWRYSCVENYTRMKSFSDTGSFSDEKRGLDLYPTPHQTLPPLYADSDYKWADEKYDDSARVDMGGFTNRSFARDELVDIDSEEEVASPRDRNNTGFSPRDIYQV